MITDGKTGVLRENHRKSHRQLWHDPYDLGNMLINGGGKQLPGKGKFVTSRKSNSLYLFIILFNDYVNCINKKMGEEVILVSQS